MIINIILVSICLITAWSMRRVFPVFIFPEPASGADFQSAMVRHRTASNVFSGPIRPHVRCPPLI